jgi:hypothetical protein
MVLFIICCILTSGLVWIVCFWLPRMNRRLLYKYSDVHKCTHFFVLNWDGEWTIVRKIDVRIAGID